MIWDQGSFENIRIDEKGKPIDPKKFYTTGTVEVNLKGKKLKGGYTMIKMKSGNMKGNWLLIKMDDNQADARPNPVNTENKCLVRKNTMNHIAKEEE